MHLKDIETTAAPTTAGDLEIMLLQLLDALRYVHPDDCPGDIADAVERMDGGSVDTFGAAGLLTNDPGLVLRFANGAAFQLTIVQSDGPEVDESRCALCGEAFADEEEGVEMYDPNDDLDAEPVMCHGECGLNVGYEVA